jgi:hypothetical protein
MEVIDIILCEYGKVHEQVHTVSLYSELSSFRKAAQILLNLDNSTCDIWLERTNEPLKDNLTFAAAGIKAGDRLVLMPNKLPSQSSDFLRASQTTNSTRISSLVVYKLQIVSSSDEVQAYNYLIELSEFHEDNPLRFFSDFNSREKHKFIAKLQEQVTLCINLLEVDKILQEWCQDILLGYRNTAIKI